MSLTVQCCSVERQEKDCYTDLPHPRLFYQLASNQPGTKQTAYQIQMPGWDSGRVEGEQPPYIILRAALRPFARYDVTLTVWDNHGQTASGTAFFATARMGTPWQAAWITDRRIVTKKKQSPQPVTLRRQFQIDRKVHRAIVMATAVGNYFLNCNGQRLGENMLAPGYTSYENVLQYQVYDITSLLQAENTLSAVVSGGWAVGYFGFMGASCAYAPRQMFMGEIRLEYADGTVEVIGTDGAWESSLDGPYRAAGIYEGVSYDARITPTAMQWKAADIGTWRYHPRILATYGVLPFRQEILHPIEQRTSRRGGTIYDFGQNCSAVVRLHIKKASAGQQIIVKHAEVLVDGEIFTSNLRHAQAMVAYICKDGPQEFVPELTTMGFRYVRIQGIAPEDLDVSAQVVSSLGQPTGGFRCSDERLNRLQSNIQWGARSNFVDIPTDCPQRDERMGWTGDIAVFASTACFNFETGRFFDKWLRDVLLDQGKGGGVPFVIPAGKLPIPIFATAGWSDCAALVPWAQYLKSGDKALLKRQYPGMKKLLKAEKFWAGFLSAGRRRFVWKWPFQFGDWLSPGETQKQWTYKGTWIATAYFYNTAHIVAQAAHVLGEAKDEACCLKLMDQIQRSYRDVFTDGVGRLGYEFESGYICPIYFGMLSPREREEMGNHLTQLVRNNRHKVNTGFLGTPYLLFALSDTGHSEDAYRVLLQEDCPGWLYTVRMGATTIWERWDALLPDGSVNLSNDQAGGKSASSKDFDPEDQTAPSMTSFNHYAYGAVGDWLYRRCVGMEAMEAGWRRFRVAPVVGGELTWAEARTATPYGEACARWSLDDGLFVLTIHVPVGSMCEARLPDGTVQELDSGDHTLRCEEKNRESHSIEN